DPRDPARHVVLVAPAEQREPEVGLGPLATRAIRVLARRRSPADHGHRADHRRRLADARAGHLSDQQKAITSAVTTALQHEVPTEPVLRKTKITTTLGTMKDAVTPRAGGKVVVCVAAGVEADGPKVVVALAARVLAIEGQAKKGEDERQSAGSLRLK